MQIDHDPKEPPRYKGGNGIFYAWAVILPVLWAGFYFTGMLDWHSAVLGLGTGAICATILTEITGNRVPPWMRR